MSATKRKHFLFGLALAAATVSDVTSGAAGASALVGLVVNLFWLAEV